MDKNDLKAEIRRLLNERGAVVVAIDGNSASGKTTLAEELRRSSPPGFSTVTIISSNLTNALNNVLTKPAATLTGRDFGKKWRNPQGCTGTRNAANIFAGQANCPLHLR